VESPDKPRFAHLASLFDELVELEPEARRARLEELSRADPGTAREIAALLDADATPSGILDASGPGVAEEMIAAAPGETAEAQDLADRRLGSWRLLRQIGRGGMGEVWLAERGDGAFDQQVAVKILRSGLDTGEVARRFLRERQLLARLQHPNIARLLDAGITTLGRPYFVMEYVEGLPITAFAEARRLPLTERVRLIVTCCEAVEVAHRQLVVHRDLKPSNILVTSAGELKLLDFGIAKSLASEREGEESLTRLESRVLTPDYAAPEQVLGEPVTTATDVFGLGTVLYELLVGVRPYQRDTSGSLPELVRAMEDETIEAPSDAVLRAPEPAQNGAPARSPAERRALAKRLRGDLDTIVLKALAREPERRYPSAAALREDLKRYLASRPVKARPESLTYRSARFVARHRGSVAAGAALSLALIGGVASTVWQARRAERQAVVASEEARRAQQAQRFLASLFEQADPERTKGEKLTARDILDRGAERLDKELANEPALHAEMASLIGQVYRQLSLLPQAQALLERAVRLQRAARVPPAQLAESLRRLGLVHHTAGRYEPAEPLLREALELLEREGNALRAASVLNDLTNLKRATGHPAEARELIERSIALRRANGEAESPSTAKALNNLGLVLWRLGKPSEAIAAFEQALALHTRNEGEKSPLVGTTLDNLGQLYSETGDHERARRSSERAVAILESVFGAEHAAVATAHNTLAQIRSKAGDKEAARQSWEKAVRIYEKTLGPEHPHLAFPLRGLGGQLWRAGKPREALPYYERALAVRRKAYQGDHLEVAQALMDVGRLRWDLREMANAEQLHRQSVAMFRRLLPADSPRLAAQLHNLASFLADRPGHGDESLSLAEETLGIRRAQLPAGDALIAESEKFVARLRGGSR
jgi:serine/threonine-protein kinase